MIASTNKTSKTPNRPLLKDEGFGGAGSSLCSSSRRACCSASSIVSNRASRSLASHNCACNSSSRVSGGARPPAAWPVAARTHAAVQTGRCSAPLLHRCSSGNGNDSSKILIHPANPLNNLQRCLLNSPENYPSTD